MRPARKGDGTGLSFPGYSEVRTGDGDVVWSAGPDIPDSLVDNFEDTDADPPGFYESGDTISTYYTVSNASFTRSTDALVDEKSVRRDTVSGFSSAMVSAPGDGLSNYPSEGETISAIIDNIDASPGVIAGVPSDGTFSGYVLAAFASDNWQLQTYTDASGTNTIDTSSVSVSLPVEVVINPPASGESTVEGSVWSLDSNLDRNVREISLSGTDSTYAGERGVGLFANNDAGTGVFADDLRRGRPI